MNLHGEVFTMKVFAVVCEGRRRQLLSMIWWEIEGFLLTVGDGCRKLGVMVEREFCVEMETHVL